MNKKAKARIISSMVELLKTTPYDKLTINAICRNASITRQTFYLYYKSKDEVIKKTYMELFEQKCLHKIKDESYFSSDDFLDEIIDNYDTYSELYKSLDKRHVLSYLTKDVLVTIQAIINERFRVEFIKQYSSYYLSAVYTPIHAICMQWIMQGKKESREELKNIITRFVYRQSTGTT